MSKARDYGFDTIKGITIFLVVLFHMAGRLFADSEVLALFRVVIQSFAMPLFVFISGYFSKNAYRSDRFPRNLVKNLLLPFCLAHAAMWLLTSRSLDKLFTPSWTLWYLLSLIFWKMLVAPAAKLRLSIPISILAAL